MDSKPNLDRDMLKTLRASQGMSQSQLARALGVSHTIVRDLELGRNQNDLQLRFLARLADVLEANLRDIVRIDPHAPDPDADDIRVEALLSYERQPLSAQEITAAFGWTLPHTRHALRQLHDRLATGGTRLRETNNGAWKITPHHSAISTSDRDRLAQARLRKKGLTTTEARVLRQVAEGLVNHTWTSKAKRHELMAARSLLEMGLITTNEHGTTVMAPKVERSLHIAP